jgi:diguanylate cyclase (GGDEF)-like protein
MSSAPLPAAEHLPHSADAPGAPARNLTEYLRRAAAHLCASAVGLVPASGGPPKYFARTTSVAQLLSDICASGSLKALSPRKDGVFGANRVRAESGGPARGRLIGVPLKSEGDAPPDVLVAVRLIEEAKFDIHDSQKLIALAKVFNVLLSPENATRTLPRITRPAAAEQTRRVPVLGAAPAPVVDQTLLVPVLGAPAPAEQTRRVPVLAAPAPAEQTHRVPALATPEPAEQTRRVPVLSAPAPAEQTRHVPVSAAPAAAEQTRRVPVLAAPAPTASSAVTPAVVSRSPPAVEIDHANTAAHPDLVATVVALLGWSEFEKHVRARESNDRLPGCVLYGDVDKLQVLNKLAGFAVGDRAISEVDRALQKATLPPGSCSCHLAGDRYAVYIPSTTLAQARDIAEQLTKNVGALSVLAHGVPTPLSISFGVSLITTSQGGLSHALAAAEAACKTAKDRGRGRAEVYQEADPSVAQGDDALIAEHLREALAAGRIELFAQPIVRLNGVQAAAHYELLMRLIGDGGTYLSPSSFMSVATRFRMLVDLDRAVVRYVLKKLDVERNLITRRNLRFSVNLSGPSISDADFLEWVVSSIAEAGIPGEWLQFEITETAAVANISQTQAMIKRLQERGVQFALDDFGTGVNSLTYLKHFDVKMLKLDGSYVRDLSSNLRSESLVRGIAHLGRGMKIETVAECVETADVRNRLTELGIDWAQGFLFGRPKPLNEVLVADDRPVEVWGRRSGR